MACLFVQGMLMNKGETSCIAQTFGIGRSSHLAGQRQNEHGITGMQILTFLGHEADE